MKSFKSMVMGLVAGSAIVLLSSVSFADEAQNQAKIKLLNDSAAALAQSNPGLAASLTKFATQEAAEKEEKNEGKEGAEKADKNEEKKEPEGLKEEGKKKEHAEYIKLLRDSAAALKQMYPELTLSLMAMADRSEKKMMKEGKEGEKEEAGEAQENEIKK